MADKIKGSTIASTFQRVLLRDKDADIGADAAAVNIEVQKIDADIVADSSLSISTNRLGINATTPQKALHVVGDVYVTGNLEIDGTTTTIDSTTVTVADQNIVLGNVGSPTNVTADGGGITLLGDTSKTLNWVSANSAWTSSEHIDIATGKEYKINNASILSNTTLGSSVLTSSLTSVGIIGTGEWAATDVAVSHGGTGASNASDARDNLGLTIGEDVMIYDDTMLVDADIGSTVMAYDSTMLVDADIGSTVMAYDSTMVVDADIGSTVQAFDAELSTLAALTEVQGSLIVGNATPEWSALAVGTTTQVLTSNGTIPVWASVDNDMLANDSVSFGGISVDLGSTDDTPAFDLSDAPAAPPGALPILPPLPPPAPPTPLY